MRPILSGFARGWLQRVAAAGGLTLALASTAHAQPAWAHEDHAIDFGGKSGTWILSGTTWAPLLDLSPLAMVTGDIDGNASWTASRSRHSEPRPWPLRAS